MVIVKRKTNIDMTQGIIAKHIFFYAVPVLFGELFQQMYNTIDTLILGNYVSMQAMAAVAGTSTVTKILVGFFNGISVGCTVIVARCFGKKDAKVMGQCVASIVKMSVLMGAVLSLVGVVIAEPVLTALSTPEDVYPYALIYIRIYFTGLMGLIMYNTITGILRAVGDVRQPFFILVFTSVLNISLDLIAVFWLRMGVVGVGLATTFSQMISAVLCLYLLLSSSEVYRLQLKIPMNKNIIKEVFHIGIPTGIQRSLTSFSNVILLSNIGYFGSSCLAGWSVYTKVSHFVVIGLQSIGSAVTTFIGQNMGANQIERTRKGIRIALGMGLLFTAVMSFGIWICTPQIARMFGKDEGMLFYAEMFLSHLIMLQMAHVIQSIYSAALRGFGQASKATVTMLCGLIGARQIYLLLITPFINTPLVVGLAFPFGWFVSGMLLYIIYRQYCKSRNL